MPLDLSDVARQIRKMAEELEARQRREEDSLCQALDVLHRCRDLAELQAKIGDSRTSWPVAWPVEEIGACHPLPATAGSYVVIAADGSQIEPDRHGAALCYLINIGSAVLRYGESPKAFLASQPYLGFQGESLYLVSNRRYALVQGDLLSINRHIAEGQKLAQLAATQASGGTTLALLDGTLTLGALREGVAEEDIHAHLLQEFLASLDALHQTKVPVASYVSRPRSDWVVNALRIALCPRPTPNCRRYCPETPSPAEPPCTQFGGVLDGQLFQRLPLRTAERSALFRSPLRISLERYGIHRVHFFYLNVGREIARVEVPQWVAEDAAMVGTVQAIIHDQCHRGGGYPRALIEAHEKAVVHAADRQQFQNLLDAALVDRRLPVRISEKARSKQIRGV